MASALGGRAECGVGSFDSQTIENFRGETKSHPDTVPSLSAIHVAGRQYKDGQHFCL